MAVLTRLPGNGDHPRTCGEHTSVGYANVIAKGSSPHMRGTRDHPRRCAVDGGIIPAHAGNTDADSAVVAHIVDHPRTCGEHSHVTLHSLKVVGSSPHMRGTRFIRSLCFRCSGIIPAHAGNTSRPPAYSTRSRDHPRTCGEHSSVASHLRVNPGSSPHMRGTPRPPSAAPLCQGIIPAHAGNT